MVEDFIALSDHKLVLLDAPCLVEPHLAAGFGRVAWTSGAEWEAGLIEVAPTLAALAHAVELLLESQWLRPAWHGGSATRLHRRAVLMRLHGAAMQCTLLLAMAQELSALSGDPRERGHQLRRR